MAGHEQWPGTACSMAANHGQSRGGHHGHPTSTREDPIMLLEMDLPSVSACDATQCAYNTDGDCHARAITVGDSITPHCDTFFETGHHVKNTQHVAGVGACKIAECRHNADLECHADSIKVGVSNGGVTCETFEAA